MDGIGSAIARAARFLVAHQGADGAWREYEAMPVGASDGWVSAFVGRFLAHPAVARRVPEAWAAAQRAASYLERQAGPGWGYNAASGPDADSTAHGLALRQQLGLPLAEADIAWLLARWRPNGGCATYDRQDAWGIAHPCVTPVAWLALPPARRMALADAVRGFILACRADDGGWPAYWWRGRHYSSFWNARALCELAPQTLSAGLPVAPGDGDCAFDVACAFGISVLAGRPDMRLGRRLLEAQQPDGHWPGAPQLLLTHPACFRPWLQPHGAYYADTHHLITTAIALDVLSLCAVH